MRMLNSTKKLPYGLTKGEVGIIHGGKLVGMVDSTTYYKPGGSKGPVGYAELSRVTFFYDPDYVDICESGRPHGKPLAEFDLIWLATRDVVKFRDCWVMNFSENKVYHCADSIKVDRIDIAYLAYEEAAYA